MRHNHSLAGGLLATVALAALSVGLAPSTAHASATALACGQNSDGSPRACDLSNAQVTDANGNITQLSNLLKGTRLTDRAPTALDSGTAGVSLWLAGGHMWRLDDATTNNNIWTDITSTILPGDVVGLRVASAALTTNGSGYVAGEVLGFTNGLYITINTVANGVPATWTISDPHWLACAPTGAVSQLSTTGAGTGAAFTLTMIYPALQGTRLLTKCYSGGEKVLERRDTGAQFTVPFLASGAADEGAEDKFAQGTSPSVITWLDQGGSGQNASNTLIYAPVSFAGRKLGNSRPIMFNYQGTLTDPATYPQQQFSSLLYPGTLATNTANNTLITYGSAMTVGNTPIGFLLTGGAFAGAYAALSQNNYSATAAFASYGGINMTGSMREDGSIFEGTTNGTNGIAYLDGHVSTASSGIGQSFAQTGGKIGFGAASTSGEIEENVAMVLPFSLTQTELVAVAASIEQTFAVQPQGQNYVGFMGTSQVSSYGSSFQQTWSLKLSEAMNRPDVHFYNYAMYGDTCVHQLSLFPTVVSQDIANHSGNKTLVMACGSNDLNTGTWQQVVTYYEQFNTQAHTLGAKTVCIFSGNNNRTGNNYPTVQSYNDAMASVKTTITALGTGQGGQTCDQIDDETLIPAYSSDVGPFTSNLYFSDQIHRSRLGQALESEYVLPLVAATQ